MHLTLRFHGQVPADEVNDLAAALRPAADGATAFMLRLGKLGAFPHTERPRVLWAGLEGDRAALDTTADRVATASANWGDHQEEKPFHPHLTLGRLPFTPPHVASTAWWQIDPGEVAWEVGEFCLFQSSLQPGGAHHQVLATFPLAP